MVAHLPAILAVTAQQWTALNASVGGRLNTNIPFSAPCFPSLEGDASFANAAACAAVKSNYLSGPVRVAARGAYTNTQWETCQSSGEQCLLDWTNPNNTAATSPPYTCKYGSISRRYIDVQTPNDVVEAFKFSKKTKVPLVIRNTGHDYEGRSSAPDSLQLSTSNLKDISYNPSFFPDGCQTAYPGLTVGAGVLWAAAYEFADAHNITVVGGNDPSVGAGGGWVQGGGHGALSNTLGLGVDRVIQFKVVVPSGKYLTANACQNTDLFFALRGGGGSTFGVVLEVTYKVEPHPVPLQVMAVGWDQFDIELTRELWSIYVDNAEKWGDQGFGGGVLPNGLGLATPLLNDTEAAATAAPIKAFADRLKAANITGVNYQQIKVPNWLTFYKGFVASNPADDGIPEPVASRLIQRPVFKTADLRSKLKDALMASLKLADRGVWLLIAAPTSYPGDGLTSVTEAWRDTIIHAIAFSSFNFNSTLAEKKAAYTRISSAVDGLRKITPDAAYINEADVYEPNYEVSFWGTNYDKLLKTKQKYDPDGLLNCWHCVGWNKNSGRYACYL